MTDPDIDHLIILYLSNRASEDEKKEFEHWVDASEDNKEIFEHIKKIWSQPSKVRVSDELIEKRDKIWDQGIRHSQVKKMASKVDMLYWTKIAATILILFISSSIVFWIGTENKLYETEQLPEPVALIQKQNPAGQKSMHMLPDGTQVWLNAESSLIFPEVFSDTLRLVKLTGEAYFEVAHSKSRPFIVETSENKIEALGTSFNIKAYPEEHITKVALLEGKVSVQDQKMQVTILMPGEELFISKNGGEPTTYHFNYEKTFGWKQGILIFDGVDFKTFCSMIEKWYGVKIEIHGQPKIDWDLRARYINQNLRFLLRDISFNKNFQYELNDKKLLIKFNKKMI